MPIDTKKMGIDGIPVDKLIDVAISTLSSKEKFVIRNRCVSIIVNAITQMS
jgi:hypothetical protein